MDRRGFIALASGLLVPAGAALARPRRRAAELAAPFAQFPFPTALADFDFQRQLYFWGGAAKKTSDFTSFVLGAGSIDAQGLLPASDTVITVATAGIGTVKSFVGRLIPTSTPAAARAGWELHDGTASNRIRQQQATTGSTQTSMSSGGTLQASGTATGLVARHSVAMSWVTDSVKSVFGGVPAGNPWSVAEDTSATIPTVTTFQIGKGQNANSQYSGYVQRIVLFGAQLDYPDLSRMVLGILP